MITLTENAIVKRVNRALAHDDETLRKTRSQNMRFQYGDWYIHHRRYNYVVASYVDPELLGRELGVVRDCEQAAG